MVRVYSKNDAKRNKAELYHPYNTRSRSTSHHKTRPPPPQLKDTAVKNKPAASAAEGERRRPAKKVPLSLYNAIQLALSARKVWNKRKDKRSESDLEFAENSVETVADLYKSKNALPRTWKYNPATASTLEPKDNISLLRLSATTRRRPYPVSYNVCNPSTERPNVNSVPLKEDETESWLQFKKLDDEGNSPLPCPCDPSLGPCPCELNFPVSTEHPFVRAIGYFAVNGFNEAFEMFVENGNHNRLRDPTFRECTYFKENGSYWFNMTLLADEDGFRGIYEAIVECTDDHGKRTLKEFYLTGIEHGKKKRASKSKSSKGVGVYYPNIDRTGMCRRSFDAFNYGCYDYCDPSEIIG